MADTPAMASGPIPIQDRVLGDTRPVPDPTALTNDLVAKAIQAEREWAEGQIEVLRERMNGMDRANQLVALGVGQVPGVIDEKVAHLKEVTDEKFHGVDQRFRERDVRLERESRDAKVAVEAAFAAQKEAVSEQDKSNTQAISKSEAATEKTLNGLSAKLDEFKEEITRRFGALELLVNGLIQGGAGGRTQKDDSRATVAFALSGVLGLLTIIGFALAIFANSKP